MPVRASFGRVSTIRWGVVIGGCGGPLELLCFWLKCQYFDPRNYNVSRHFPWMFLVSGILATGSASLLLATIEAVRPGLVRARIGLSILLFIAILGVLFRLPVATAACLILAAGAAVRLSFYLERIELRPLRRPSRVSLGVAGIAAAAFLLVQADGSRPSNRFPSKPTASLLKNVLLIVLDTVRADRLGRVGDLDGTMPNLARIAERGVRFDRAYSTAPWTAPSHASMFTGKLPHELAIGWNSALEKGPATLAEVLTERGFSTSGFVANTTYCSYETGLDRGFGHYEDYDLNLGSLLLCSSIVQRGLNFVHQHPNIEKRLPKWDFASSTRKDGARIRGDFRRWRSNRADRPFFAFLNFYDAHHPYLAPESDPSPEARRLLKTWWEADKRALSRKDVSTAREAYDDCIRSLDREIGELFDELDREGILKETLVLVTADHGEHLGEHDLYGHGCSLYGSELHVPLVVIGEGVAPQGLIVPQPATLRDLPATVLDLLGLESAHEFPGRSLAESWVGESSEGASSIFSEIDLPPEADPNSGESPIQKGSMRSLVANGMHYIRNGDGVEELYELESDPNEQGNLADDPTRAIDLKRIRELARTAVDSGGS